MKKTWLFLLLFISCIICALGFSACSSTNKYGKEETYYDLNNGNTFYFDGKGNCNYAGLECTYEIMDDNYRIYFDKTDKMLIFKKVKDGVLIETFKNLNSFLNVPVRSGYISGSTTINNSLVNYHEDGTYEMYLENTLVGIGNYYFNDGVLITEQTYGMTSSGFWLEGTLYSAAYINEDTGKLSGVILANPSYYLQWHFNDNNDNEGDTSTNTQHTLTYDLDYDGLTVTAEQVVKGEIVNLITPERAGYKFLGWYYNGSKIDSGVWVYDCDVTLTAHWEAINYSIKYHTNGGILPDYYLESYTVLSDLPYTLPIPIKQGFNFLGWYETSDFSGEPITDIPKNSLQNYVLYAKYTDEQLLEFELSFDETYYSVVGYKGSPQYISIPKEINGLPVKEIAAKAFSACDSLINISLPDSVTSIGNCAFSYCYWLTSITIPDCVAELGEFAFEGCNRLTNITIPTNVTTIGHGLFLGCSSLISVTIPDSVTSIGDSAFSYCSSLTSVTIPNSVTSIGRWAFSDCSSLTNITIPDSVTGIGEGAFSDCSSLTNITIPDSVTNIGSSAFPNHLYNRYSGCYYLPTKSSDYGFLYEPIDKDTIVNVKIHTDCKIINYSVFSNCDNLTNVIMPEGVTKIGDYAFAYCSSLTSVTIPDSVTSIGNYTFYYCDSMTSVFYKGTAEDWNHITLGESAFIPQSKIYYFSVTEPIDGGNYWHYDTDETTPVIW